MKSACGISIANVQTPQVLSTILFLKSVNESAPESWPVTPPITRFLKMCIPAFRISGDRISRIHHLWYRRQQPSASQIPRSQHFAFEQRRRESYATSSGSLIFSAFKKPTVHLNILFLPRNATQLSSQLVPDRTRFPGPDFTQGHVRRSRAVHFFLRPIQAGAAVKAFWSAAAALLKSLAIASTCCNTLPPFAICGAING